MQRNSLSGPRLEREDTNESAEASAAGGILFPATCLQPYELEMHISGHKLNLDRLDHLDSCPPCKIRVNSIRLAKFEQENSRKFREKQGNARRKYRIAKRRRTT